MTAQEILFIVAIVFFVLAAIFAGLAVFIFFARNVPDVRADLSGKKRAEGVAQIDSQRPGRDRRKGVARVEPTSGQLAPTSGSLDDDVPTPATPQAVRTAQPAPKAPPAQSATWQGDSKVSAPDDGATSVLAEHRSSATDDSDDGATTILPDDSTATTVLPQESASAAGADGGSAAKAEATVSFTVVRKIVLRESAEFIEARGGGDG